MRHFKIWPAAIAAILIALPGCLGGGGDDDGGIFDPMKGLGFWAFDFRSNSYYSVQAAKVAEGTRCHLYVAAGVSVDQATVDAIKAEFDNVIYPATTAAYGSEPNPGVDGDPKIHILLLDIRDDFLSTGTYVGGYFDSMNEFLQRDIDALGLPQKSVEKEIFYMDVFPLVPGGKGFYRTLAHEFQHMIHFGMETTAKDGAPDDIWLNEAMSEISPVYSGYGTDYGRVFTFEQEPWNSLTVWGDRVEDYGVVHMWAQYLRDRVDPGAGDTIFRRMLNSPLTGIDSVNAALAEIGYGKDFAGVLRDWAVANYTGSNAAWWPANPEWSYVSLNTWPGTYFVPGDPGITLPGLFSGPGRTNESSLRTLDPWSLDYYLYTPPAGTTGTVAWNPAGQDDRAALADNTAIVFDLSPGIANPYSGGGYLMVQNLSSVTAGGDSVVFASLDGSGPDPAAALRAAGRSSAVRKLIEMTGEPVPLCVQPHFSEAARRLKALGAKPSL